MLQQKLHRSHCHSYREQNTSHTPFQFSATAQAAALAPLMKHSNPFGCLSDKDNDKASTVESALDSTTSDEFSGTNGDAFYVSTNLDQQQQVLGLSPSCCTSLGPLSGTSLESITMSHWQQQHSPLATTIPHDSIEYRATVAVTAIETENKKKVVGLDDNDNVMKGGVRLYAPGNDEDGATVTSKYSKEKIDVLMDEDNKEEDNVVDTFDDSNSKNAMFLYASSIDKVASSEDQDSVICYEDQSQRKDCTGYNNVDKNDEGRTQTSYKSCMTPQIHYFDCYDTEDNIIFVDCVEDLVYPNDCASNNARKLTLSYGSILNTNLDLELGHEFGQSDIELEFGQSDVEFGQSQSDVELGPKLGWLNVELGQ